jgi:hypothetical protein
MSRCNEWRLATEAFSDFRHLETKSKLFCNCQSVCLSDFYSVIKIQLKENNTHFLYQNQSVKVA